MKEAAVLFGLGVLILCIALLADAVSKTRMDTNYKDWVDCQRDSFAVCMSGGTSTAEECTEAAEDICGV